MKRQIVIELDEDVYAYMKEHNVVPMESDSMARLLLNGTPLPKGHGNLKDEDEIFDAFDFAIHYAYQDGHEYANAFESNGRWCAEYDSIKSMIYDAKTIIEADKENE